MIDVLAGVDLQEMFEAKRDIDIIRAKPWYRIGRVAKRKTLNFLRKRHWIR